MNKILDSLELSLQQAITGIHSQRIVKIEKKLSIGGVEYSAKIYSMNDAGKTI